MFMISALTAATIFTAPAPAKAASWTAPSGGFCVPVCTIIADATTCE